MIDNYQALPMGHYAKIDALLKERDGQPLDLDTQVAVLCILTGKSEADVLALSLPDYAAMTTRAAFLTRPIDPLPEIRKEYEVGDYTLTPCRDYRKLTAGQYIDFQAFTRDGLDFLGLLSVLLIPKGHKYGDGYDPLDVRNALAEGLSTPDGMALTAFFLRQFVVLIHASLTYSEREVRRMKPGKRKEDLLRKIERTRGLLRLAGAG